MSPKYRFPAFQPGCEVLHGFRVGTDCGETGGEDEMIRVSATKFLPLEVSFLLYIFSRQIAHIRGQTYHTPLAGRK